MVNDTAGLHHLHKRKRIHQKHEKFPHPNKWKRYLDHVIIAVAIIGPLMTIPQIYKIWIYHNASGVSLLTWSTYLLTSFIWLAYSIAHKDKALFLAYVLWIIITFLVVIGVLLYG
jgi:uncharacterized protein with PQ loop repeat